MKILHVITTFSIDYPGGITNYIRTLAASQIRSGDRVDILDGGSSDSWGTHASGFRVRSTRASRRKVHVASTKPDPRGTQEILDLVTQEAYDMVHFHLTINLGETFYTDFSRIGVPYVVSLHDYYLFCPRITMMDYSGSNCGGPELAKCERCIGPLDQIDLLYRASRKSGVPLPRAGRSSAVTKRNGAIETFLRNAEAVLAVSARVADFFVGRYPSIRCEVLHIGSSSAIVDRPPKTPSAQVRVGYIGTLSEMKGAGVLEELASQTRREDLEFGFWGRVLGAEWSQRLETAGVALHGPYTPETLPGILSEIDLGIVPPIWEDNAPQVVMEFLNSGIPVMATRMGGIPDFVDERNGFLFDPDGAGLEEAAEFLGSVTRLRLSEMADAIEPLTTPEEHRRALDTVYRRARLS